MFFTHYPCSHAHLHVLASPFPTTHVQLYINLLKTKIVVFRNRGVLKENEKWYLDGKMIELCNQIVYLGFLFKGALATILTRQIICFGNW